LSGDAGGGIVSQAASLPSLAPGAIPSAPYIDDVDNQDEEYDHEYDDDGMPMDEESMLAIAIEASLKPEKSIVELPSSSSKNSEASNVVSIDNDDDDDNVVVLSGEVGGRVHTTPAAVKSIDPPANVFSPIDPPPSVLPVEPSDSGSSQTQSDDITRVQLRFPDGSRLVRFVYTNEPVAALYYYAAHKLQKGHVAASFYTAFLATCVDSAHDKREPYVQGDKVPEMIVDRFGDKVVNAWEIVLSNVSVVTVLGPEMYGKTIFDAGLNRATLIVRNITK
jgi:hypothetical protein